MRVSFLVLSSFAKSRVVYVCVRALVLPIAEGGWSVNRVCVMVIFTVQ